MYSYKGESMNEINDFIVQGNLCNVLLIMVMTAFVSAMLIEKYTHCIMHIQALILH